MTHYESSIQSVVTLYNHIRYIGTMQLRNSLLDPCHMGWTLNLPIQVIPSSRRKYFRAHVQFGPEGVSTQLC